MKRMIVYVAAIAELVLGGAGCAGSQAQRLVDSDYDYGSALDLLYQQNVCGTGGCDIPTLEEELDAAGAIVSEGSVIMGRGGCLIIYQTHDDGRRQGHATDIARDNDFFTRYECGGRLGLSCEVTACPDLRW